MRHCSIPELGRGAYNRAVAPGITRPLHATAFVPRLWVNRAASDNSTLRGCNNSKHQGILNCVTDSEKKQITMFFKDFVCGVQIQSECESKVFSDILCMFWSNMLCECCYIDRELMQKTPYFSMCLLTLSYTHQKFSLNCSCTMNYVCTPSSAECKQLQ